eukprot:TRINITY_DN19760_c0_g1::TRINITY_DN19760_c0_g1_i1::g.11349::m.11349 TRINITY_DN19760_c0_g1::TRINITY_DN19760_c0_g1_i1::g.11349  ORF type:complete len:638 (-),score=180.58,sp/F1Q8W0/CATIN_DANRE/39.78/6e-126,CactinC_cactus/PF09732.4/1.4e-54,Cactin_mid/PF10312.4/3.9e+03,Cactin_mid/PF10312.4/2.7e-53 TRINITY_DN19760_c0_g1_i1:251-2128(-)
MTSSSESDRKSRKHRKDKKKRRRSASSSSSSSSSDSSRDDKRRRKDKPSSKHKDDKRNEKEIKRQLKKRLAEEKRLRKLTETPEERRARRLKKKEEKRKKVEEDNSICGYTNDANPFGDANLTNKFVWHKKRDQDMTKGVNPDAISKDEEKKQREKLYAEILKVKTRREEREREKRLWEEEQTRMARREDALAHAEWQKQEEDFHLQQAKLRSEIRIEEGRAKPIDIIYHNLNPDASLDKDFNLQLNEPYAVFHNLGIEDLRELESDIRMYMELDKQDHERADFWNSMLVLCEDTLRRAEENKNMSSAQLGMQREVNERVEGMLRGKDLKQLVELETAIKDKIDAGDVAVDVEFMDHVLQRLQIAKAKSRLMEIHERILERKLAKLEEAAGGSESEAPSAAGSDLARRRITRGEAELSDEEGARRGDGEDGEGHEGGAEVLADTMPNTEQADKDALARMKRTAPDGMNPEDKLWMEEAARQGGEGDLAFNLPVPLQNEVYHWADKFRPRPPRFFNRVQTGYEWNKYNQTHYDHDNPPPKVVQGYKFNIFYPDLIDKTKLPTYKLTPTDNPDIVTIRFHAGPPYEDIAFKIVNREWEYASRRGFKCKFERGVFQLHFSFKRLRYRR